jgi:hypothetical protein
MTIAKIGSRGLGGARGFERAALDFYPTDSALTRALLNAEQFVGDGIWEPACGDGAMSRILDVVYPVTSTDLVSYGYGRSGIDFLTTTELRKVNIVTNPPFKLWLPFAKHALSLKPEKLVLLGRLLMLEGWERSAFFKESGLTRVWVMGRAKMLPPGAEDKGHNGMICFAWYVWQRGHTGAPTVHWRRP